jgi:hypothetical protein
MRGTFGRAVHEALRVVGDIVAIALIVVALFMLLFGAAALWMYWFS